MFSQIVSGDCDFDSGKICCGRWMAHWKNGSVPDLILSPVEFRQALLEWKALLDK